MQTGQVELEHRLGESFVHVSNRGQDPVYEKGGLIYSRTYDGHATSIYRVADSYRDGANLVSDRTKMNYDILVQIAEHLSPPSRPSSTYSLPFNSKAYQLAFRTLYTLSLVSKSCATAAARILYRNIVITPESIATQDVHDCKSGILRTVESEEVVSSTCVI